MRQATRITDIISIPLPPPVIIRRLGRLTELVSPFASARVAKPDEFERRVLTFLVEQRQALGIARVFRAQNLLVDGGLILVDGRFLAVEIKYRMNWPKACQTGWQFGEFSRTAEARQYRPVGGIVFFEEFSGDWARLLGQTERGWANWYAGHATLPGDDTFRLDLVRFRGGELESVLRQKA